ncbi:1-acyl-sn-glycerol-3-phosphate acyltransferase [Cypionkella aquatica]|uniref:1-acyl-sn-glycerol-3-phosphate acyltransferase n=1 Tax=Cypionkella aquatica TaxID=1756042 RepID=A0AA37X3T1_9RHOB|nr:lysophospholipid acyltransferase family protein [Cypionkella aquatica]GLS88655.1 1-acyl-sn-glycerol-3-phosphate acyltransferase [Cypionkella aquatica]
MNDWRTAPAHLPPITPLGWLRVAWRGFAFGFVTYFGLVLLLLVRLVERPLFGQARPWTPHITQTVCKLVFPILGLPLILRGQPMPQHGAVVANHASWLDIFALNAAQRGYFVAKSEVERWAAIGWLARATGTVFVARKGTEAKRQQALFEDRLRAGQKLMFFPEGTSTDAIRVLPFKSTLFAAFFSHGLADILHIQPVSVIYHAPKQHDPRFYGWWGEMDFASHLLQVLAAKRQGRVEVIFHPAVAVNAFASRKDLAAHCEAVIRASHPFAVRH